MKSTWSHISSYIPKPEIEEIERLVGKRIIDRNERLREELNCLKEIVGDFLTHQFNRVDLLRDKEAADYKASYDKKDDFSLNTLEHCDDKSHGKSECSSLAMELVENVKDYLSINRIHQVLDKIHQALDNEKEDLEAEIQVLQSTMDVESDMLSRGSTPVSKGSTRADDRSGLRNSLCSSCGSRIDVLASSSDLGSSGDIYYGPGRVRRITHNSSVRGEKPSGSSICSFCKHHGVNFTDDNKTGGNSSSVLEVSSSLESESIQGGVYPQPELDAKTSRRPGTSGRSRIRNRIESARDERFFLDEDPFLN